MVLARRRRLAKITAGAVAALIITATLFAIIFALMIAAWLIRRVVGDKCRKLDLGE